MPGFRVEMEKPRWVCRGFCGFLCPDLSVAGLRELDGIWDVVWFVGVGWFGGLTGDFSHIGVEKGLDVVLWLGEEGNSSRSGFAFTLAFGRVEPTHVASRHEWGTRVVAGLDVWASRRRETISYEMVMAKMDQKSKEPKWDLPGSFHEIIIDAG